MHVPRRMLGLQYIEWKGLSETVADVGERLEEEETVSWTRVRAVDIMDTNRYLEREIGKVWW